MGRRSMMRLGVCLASAIGIFAASATGNPVKLVLPFEVTAGSGTLPAGECTITNLKDYGHESFFVLHSEEGPSVILMVEPTGGPDVPYSTSSAVHLRHTGNNYEIDGIRINGKAYKVN